MKNKTSIKQVCERSTRPPLPRVRFSIQLSPKSSLDEIKLCIEHTLAVECEAAFPDLVKLDDNIWSYDPRDKKASIAHHYVSAAVIKERRELLRQGKTANLPIRLSLAFEQASKRAPKLAPQLMKTKFAVLELPVFWRHFRRAACKPVGTLFDVAYTLQKACGGDIKITPVRSLTSGGLQVGNLFPDRCRRPDEASVPDSANWHLLNIRAIDGNSDSLTPPGINGRGVIVGHLDTGWTAHPELNFPVAGAAAPASPNYPPGFEANTLELGRTSASEPVLAFTVPGTNAEHGTRTASVIVSRRDTNVSGVAPAALIFPVRCAHNVVIIGPYLDDLMIADAIIRAVAAGAQVISMSLGGMHSPALHWAVQFAVANNVLVVAAAGNYVPQVIFPAAYPECIAVGGSTADDCHWVYSSRNQLGITPINIAAPAEFVRNAFWNGTVPASGIASGTSFATGIVAGAAALWLQSFGRGTLIASLAGRAPLQALFMAHLAATARTPDRWNTSLDGPGILNLQTLLSAATLPNPSAFPLPVWVDPLGAAGAAIVSGFNQVTAGPLAFLGGLASDIGQEIEDYSAEIWGAIVDNPLVSGAMQGLEDAANAAGDALDAAEDAAEEIAEDLQNAANEAAETVTEATEEIVDAVVDGVSDALSDAAGWLGF